MDIVDLMENNEIHTIITTLVRRHRHAAFLRPMLETFAPRKSRDRRIPWTQLCRLYNFPNGYPRDRNGFELRNYYGLSQHPGCVYTCSYQQYWNHEVKVDFLKACCKKNGIRGYSRMRKVELIKALMAV